MLHHYHQHCLDDPLHSHATSTRTCFVRHVLHAARACCLSAACSCWGWLVAVEAFGVINEFDVSTLTGHSQDVECLAIMGAGSDDLTAALEASSKAAEANSAGSGSSDAGSNRSGGIGGGGGGGSGVGRGGGGSSSGSLPIVSTCLGGEVRVWNPETQRCMHIFKPSLIGVGSVPWSLAAHQSLVAVGYGNGKVEILNIELDRTCFL